MSVRKENGDNRRDGWGVMEKADGVQKNITES